MFATNGTHSLSLSLFVFPGAQANPKKISAKQGSPYDRYEHYKADTEVAWRSAWRSGRCPPRLHQSM